jgi:hypothetical protein
VCISCVGRSARTKAYDLRRTSRRNVRPHSDTLVEWVGFIVSVGVGVSGREPDGESVHAGEPERKRETVQVMDFEYE